MTDEFTFTRVKYVPMQIEGGGADGYLCYCPTY